MKKLATIGSTLCLSVLALALSVPTTSLAQSGSAPVTVVNTPSNPVPVSLQGTGNVSGNVAITNTPNVSVINTPLPVQGTVNVGNFPTTQSVSLSAIPSGAFSRLGYIKPPRNQPILGPDPGGTNYAITSLTVAGIDDADVQLYGAYFTTTDCKAFSGAGGFTDGPVVRLREGTTVHLSFPQPFVIAPQSGAKACVIVDAHILGSLDPAYVTVTVVGFKF